MKVPSYSDTALRYFQVLDQNTFSFLEVAPPPTNLAEYLIYYTTIDSSSGRSEMLHRYLTALHIVLPTTPSWGVQRPFALVLTHNDSPSCIRLPRIP